MFLTIRILYSQKQPAEKALKLCTLDSLLLSQLKSASPKHVLVMNVAHPIFASFCQEYLKDGISKINVEKNKELCTDERYALFEDDIVGSLNCYKIPSYLFPSTFISLFAHFYIRTL